MAGPMVLIGLGALAGPVAAQQPVAMTGGPGQATDTATTPRPLDVPRLHHTHLNTLDADAALDWYTDVWPHGSRGEVAGFPAFETAVPVLFTEVSEPPSGAWDPERNRAFPRPLGAHHDIREGLIGTKPGLSQTFVSLDTEGNRLGKPCMHHA